MQCCVCGSDRIIDSIPINKFAQRICLSCASLVAGLFNVHLNAQFKPPKTSSVHHHPKIGNPDLPEV